MVKVESLQSQFLWKYAYAVVKIGLLASVPVVVLGLEVGVGGGEIVYVC